jgi:Icc-related predicted phosphoesterase
MRIVCISDTHVLHERTPIEVPDGDVLIHSGDGLGGGSLSELVVFSNWLAKLPHRTKIFVPGNHDWPFQEDPERARSKLPAHVVCLIDQETTVEGLRIYGSPWQPEFCDWAFNLPRGHRLREKWNQIPHGIDILITHGPPQGILDQNYHGEHVGCADMREVVLERIKPKLHAFGHIHRGHGTSMIGRTLFVNASICDEAYRPIQAPIVVDVGPADVKVVSVPAKASPAASRPILRSTPPLW